MKAENLQFVNDLISGKTTTGSNEHGNECIKVAKIALENVNEPLVFGALFQKTMALYKASKREVTKSRSNEFQRLQAAAKVALLLSESPEKAVEKAEIRERKAAARAAAIRSLAVMTSTTDTADTAE